MHFVRITLLVGTALALPLAPAFAQTPNAPTAAMPAAAAVPMTGKADADMQKVLDALAALGPKPTETLTASDARKQPGPADAVKKVSKDEKLNVDPDAGLSVSNSHFADMGTLRLRYYQPKDSDKNSNLPTIVYFRGGGWVIADLNAYDASAAALARDAHAYVVSVDYPMAPEHKFPAAHDEAIEAYKYILKNVKGWGGDPTRVAIVGESAGGNLALNTAIAARDQKLMMPVAVVSIYPVAETAMNTPSYKEQANAKPLNAPMMSWFFEKVVAKPQDMVDPRLNLIAADFTGLPPVTIINAELDPLRSDGDMLTDKLKAAGNNVTHKIYPGVTHEFFGMGAVVAKAKEAEGYAVSTLKAAFMAKPAAK